MIRSMRKIGVLASGLLLVASTQLGLAALPAAAAPPTAAAPAHAAASSSHHKHHGHVFWPRGHPTKAKPHKGHPAQSGTTNTATDTATKRGSGHGHGHGTSVAGVNPGGSAKDAHPAPAPTKKAKSTRPKSTLAKETPAAATAGVAPSEGLFLLESITRPAAVQTVVAVTPPATPPTAKAPTARSAARRTNKSPGYGKHPLADVGAPALSLKTAGHLSIPIFFGVGVALFVLLQALVDRRDPKVSRAPQRGDEDTVGFK